MLKFLVSILLLQLAAGAEDSCPNETIPTEKVTDLEEILGDYSIAYIWNRAKSLDSRSNNVCLQTTISNVTQHEVDLTKTLCLGKVDFNWDNVKFKIITRYMPSRLISTDGTYAYILQYCMKVTKAEVRRTSAGAVLLTYPEANNATELLVQEVPSKADLLCLAENVDVTEGMSGYPLCYTQ